MNECPSCRSVLLKRSTPNGMVYLCPRCRGRSVALTVLRKAGASQQFLSTLWRKSREKGARRVRSCPHCARPMVQTSSPIAGQSIELDVCRMCASVWFDPSEFDLIPRDVARPGLPQKELPLEARKQLALWKIKRIEAQQADSESGPDEAWQWLPGILGLPVELDAPAVSQIPRLTWGSIATCVVATLLLLVRAESISLDLDVFEQWGFIPAKWYRHGGLTLITSFFLHGGIWHLLGNMYFLFIFGDNVEDRLGRGMYAVLLFLAHGVGMLAHGLFAPDPHVPCVGASAGISGVIAFYAIMYPRVRLGFLLRYWFYFRWIRIPAALALVMYALIQSAGAYFQLSGFGHVSYLGHLGGLAVGVSFAFLYRRGQRREAALALGHVGRTRR